jgi:hypothetical protein
MELISPTFARMRARDVVAISDLGPVMFPNAFFSKQHRRIYVVLSSIIGCFCAVILICAAAASPH